MHVENAISQCPAACKSSGHHLAFSKPLAGITWWKSSNWFILLTLRVTAANESDCFWSVAPCSTFQWHKGNWKGSKQIGNAEQQHVCMHSRLFYVAITLQEDVNGTNWFRDVFVQRNRHVVLASVNTAYGKSSLGRQSCYICQSLMWQHP